MILNKNKMRTTLRAADDSLLMTSLLPHMNNCWTIKLKFSTLVCHKFTET